MQENSYRFGEFVLDLSRRRLLRDGTEAKLNDNEIDLLTYLIEHRPDVCPMDDIIRAVWGDTWVEYNSVEKAVVSVRRALGDNARAPQFIKNRRGKGYAFIAEIDEAADNGPLTQPDVSHAANTAHPSDNHLHRRKGVSGFTLFALSVIAACLFVGGFVVVKGGNVLARLNRTYIVSDDFTGSGPDGAVWTVDGNGVKVADGVAQVACWETDNCGRLVSRFSAFDPARPITVESRLRVWPSKNLKNNTYFLSFFGLTPKVPDVDVRDVRDKAIFGVYYVDYDYESRYPNGEIDEFPAEGWFLFRNGGSPQKKVDYRDGKIGNRISPLWNKWFEQKVVYDPRAGTLTCYIGGELVDVFNAGDLFANIEDNMIRVEIAPRGWWLNHSIELDYIRVYQ